MFVVQRPFNAGDVCERIFAAMTAGQVRTITLVTSAVTQVMFLPSCVGSVSRMTREVVDEF